MNKNTFRNIVGAGIITMLATGCEKDLQTFDSAPAIYFQQAVGTATSASANLFDNRLVTFGYSSESVKDSIVGIPVRIAGAPAEVDRSYKVALVDSSTAKRGEEFSFLTENFVIRKGMVDDTIYIKLMRKPRMRTETLSIFLKLESNENFTTSLQQKTDAAGNVILRYNHFSLKVTDILSKPKYWLDAYFGVFSRKKILFICELNNFSPTYLDGATPPSIGLLTFYGRFTQRYLNEQKAAGNIILDEDGTEMVMGPSVQ